MSIGLIWSDSMWGTEAGESILSPVIAKCAATKQSKMSRAVHNDAGTGQRVGTGSGPE